MRYSKSLAIGGAIGLALVGLKFLPFTTSFGTPIFWAVVVGGGAMLGVNWLSRRLYRRRGGWKVHLTYTVRANVDWEALTEAEAESEWVKLGSPTSVGKPDAGWRNVRSGTLLLWFTNPKGERCEVTANPEPNPRVSWVAGLSVLFGRRNFTGFPRSLPIVIFARFSRHEHLLTGDELHEDWAAIGGGDDHLPARGMQGEGDGKIEFECHDPDGNLFFIKCGAQTQFTRWRLVGLLCMMYRDLMPRSIAARENVST